MMDLDFFTSLLLIIAIDIVLGGDNAVVIAMASRNLPEHQKRKAVLWGTGLAIVVRILATVAAAFLLNVKYLFLIGGLVLVWISYKLLVEEEDQKEIRPGENLLQAVRTIVVADIAMGLDNVLAIAGAAKGNENEVLLIVLGLLISIPIMIWGSQLIMKMMERYPWVVYVGGGILAWTAAKMILHEQMVHDWVAGIPGLSVLFQIALTAAVVALGYRAKKRAAQSAASESNTADHDNMAAGS